MENQIDMPLQGPQISKQMGFGAVLTGAVALCLVLSQSAGRCLEPNRLLAPKLVKQQVRSNSPRGVAAVVFHFFRWVAILVAGVVLLVTIIENIGDIFSF